jgi:mono/diheme cytochrome c family protein/plastocyanin
VGFLAVVVVILFVAIYWFYELGLPLGLSEPRLESEVNAQQVTAVERGYNIYEANCARCHGAQGEGGIGPTLNRQDKLFAHLNPDYLRNVLTVGGRYVCGNANSLMPVWSSAGNPPGPLNYKQIDYLIAFIRAQNDQTFTILDPSLAEPTIDPKTGKAATFKGWVDPNFKPAPGATPFPACYLDEFKNASPSGSPAASAAPGATVVQEAALGIQFVNKDLSAPADAAFTIEFDNQDAGQPHNIEIKDSSGAQVFKGDLVTGPGKATYNVPALKAGTYPFVCTVHATMTGTLTVGS